MIDDATDDAAVISRSAANWFLDAATYARDGDRDRARETALAGIAALDKAEAEDA